MKKISFLMLLALAFLLSCRTDQFPEKETYHNTSAFQLTNKRISLNDSKHKAKLLRELDNAEAKFKTFSKVNAQGKVINYANGIVDENGCIPGIPTVPYVPTSFSMIVRTLPSEVKTLLNSNTAFYDGLDAYYTANPTLQGENFVRWAAQFSWENQDVTWAQFQNWFIQEPILNNTLQNELLEDWADPNRVKPTTRFKNNALVNCIYNKAKTSANFNQYLKNFDGRFSTAHLLFDLKPIDPANNAETSTPLGYWITITINSNNLNRPSIDIARTFMHEIIHAEMFRILLSLASTSNGQINLTELTNMLTAHNYPGIYDYFRRYGVNNMQHEQMAAHYIGIMKNYLKQIDNTLSDAQAEAIAWQGLQGTERWNQLSTSQQNNINSTYSSWYNTALYNCP